MLPPLRCTRTPLSQEAIEASVNKVMSKFLQAFQPKRIYLIGSAAEGSMTDQSDLDFVIVMKSPEERRKFQKSLRPYFPLCDDIPVDIIWKTQEEFDHYKKLGGICMIAHEDGKILFDSRKQ